MPAAIAGVLSTHRRRLFGRYSTPSETLMRCAKVVDTPHQIHRTLKRLELACQAPSPTYQNRKACAKCPIKPFDVAHMCSRGGLCLFYQGLYPLGCTPQTMRLMTPITRLGCFWECCLMTCTMHRWCQRRSRGRPRLPVKMGVRKTCLIVET